MLKNDTLIDPTAFLLWELIDGKPAFFLELLPKIESGISEEARQFNYESVADFNSGIIYQYYQGAVEAMKNAGLFPDDVNVDIRIFPTLESMAVGPGTFLFIFPELKATQPENCLGVGRTYVISWAMRGNKKLTFSEHPLSSMLAGCSRPVRC
jgi:hypothetical protein